MAAGRTSGVIAPNMAMTPEQELMAIQAELDKRGDPLNIEEAVRANEGAVLNGKDYSQYAKSPIQFAKTVLNVFPWSKQREILWSVNKNPRTTVRSAHGLGKCGHFDDRLILADGRVVTHGEMIGQVFPILAFSKDGDQVPTIGIASDNGLKPTFKVTTDQGREIIRTGNHPLLSSTLGHHEASWRRTRHPSKPEWKAVEALQPDDLVLVPSELHINGTKVKDPDEVKFLGYMLGDGGTTTHVGFTQEEGEARAELFQIVNAWGCQIKPASGKSEKKIYFDIWGDGSNIEGCNPALNKIKEWGLFGKKAIQKSFPDWVWQLPNEQLALLLNRLFACDGYAYTYQTKGYSGKREAFAVEITLASKQMVRDVELAMLRLGINGRFTEKLVTCRGKKFQAWVWQAYAAKDCLKFIDKVGILGKEEALERVRVLAQAAITKPQQIKWTTQNAPEGFHWEKVRSVEPMGEQPTVAISVPDHNTYITTFVEHNTFIAASVVVWFLMTHKNSLVITTAPTARQVEELLWTEIGQLHESNGLPGRCLTTKLELGRKWQAIGLSTNKPTSFQGFHARHILIVVDEASGVPEIIYEAIEGAMTNKGARLLLIGNPNNVEGTFFDSHNKLRHIYYPIHISAYDSPALTGEPVPEELMESLVSEEWIQERKDVWGEESPIYQVRVLGNFPDQSENSLISLTWIEAAECDFVAEKAFDDTHRPAPPDNQVVLGVDIARDGGCENAVYVRRGPQIIDSAFWKFPPSKEQRALLMETSGRIATMARSYNAAINIDANGMGAGVADRLQELRFRVNRIVGQMAPTNRQNFRHYRDEVLWALRDRFRTANIGGVTDAKTQGQLAALRYAYNSVGQIEVEGKEQIRKRNHPSPDRADALALCFAPVRRATRMAVVGGQRAVVKVR